MRVLDRAHLFRIGTAGAALLSVGIALIVVQVTAAYADGYSYVAVGDSYSSGEGAGAYYDGACDQSAFSYPSEFMQQEVDYYGSGWIAACSGATTGDVSLQLGALGSDTKLVTVTAGGDDLGFGSTMSACAGIPQDCSGLALTPSQLAGVETRLAALYATILQKAPNARLYVLDYPDLFPSGSSTCQNAGIAASAVAQFHTALQQVNAMIKAAVATVPNAVYLDTTSAFAGHDICSSNSYGNGVGDALAQGHTAAAFHPNAAGYQVMTQIVYNQAVNVDHIFSPPPSGGGGGGGNPSPSSGPGGPGGPGGPDPSPSVSSTWWPN